MCPLNTFFTSDHHFGHANIIKFCNRGFDGVDDMADEYVRRWNLVVPVNGTVYHGGDMFYKCSLGYAQSIVKRLNGTIHLLRGNHDADHCTQWGLASVSDLLKIQIQGQTIVLMHYPMKSWEGSYKYETWMAHGHSHTKDVGVSRGKRKRRLDIGVDGNDGYPWRFGEIKRWMGNYADQEEIF